MSMETLEDDGDDGGTLSKGGVTTFTCQQCSASVGLDQVYDHSNKCGVTSLVPLEPSDFDVEEETSHRISRQWSTSRLEYFRDSGEDIDTGHESPGKNSRRQKSSPKNLIKSRSLMWRSSGGSTRVRKSGGFSGSSEETSDPKEKKSSRDKKHRERKSPLKIRSKGKAQTGDLKTRKRLLSPRKTLSKEDVSKKQETDASTTRCTHCKQLLGEDPPVYMNHGVLHCSCVIPFRRFSRDEKSKEALMINEYTLSKLLGTGTSASVWKALEMKTRRVVAIKVITKAGTSAAFRQRERLIMELTSDGPFLACSLRHFEDVDNMYLVMECAEGGDLFDLLSYFSPSRPPRQVAVCLAAQVLGGLEFLHMKDIIYRDLKPENVLLTSKGKVLLTDFGISKALSREVTRTQTFCGTQLYQAPELLQGLEYDKSVDWWSFGVLLYELLAGSPPFTGTPLQVSRQIINDEPTIPSEWQDPEVELLVQLLVKDPNYRIREAKEIKTSSLFMDQDWDRLSVGDTETQKSISDTLLLVKADAKRRKETEFAQPEIEETVLVF